MEPKLNLEELFKDFEDTITISNPGAASGTIGTPYVSDTITLSSLGASYSNTAISGGAYTVPSASITTTSYPYTISSGTGITQPWISNKVSPKIKLDGEGADIEVNGESLIGMIKKIEERLNILHPNEKLEAEWEELRELGNRYRELEQHIKEKQATWNRLKAMPAPDLG